MTTTALRWRKYASSPMDVEEGTFEGGGALMDKVNALQNKNYELESTINNLRAQIDILKEKSKYNSEESVDSVDINPPRSVRAFLIAAYDRVGILLLLLIVQSFSSIILGKYENLLSHHPILIYFLTMLIGAGGNAGNQAAVRVIRGIAIGVLNSRTRYSYLFNEFKIAVVISGILGFVGCVRTIVSSRSTFPETVAITITLMLITFFSIILGSILPFILQKVHLDPVHSSTIIQVIMDILGVLLTCSIATLLL